MTAFAETRSLNPVDKKLRSHGFIIHERAKNREPVWSLHGVHYTQNLALAQCGAIDERIKQEQDEK